MALWQGTSRRKPTGGRFVSAKKKRRFEVAREHVDTRIGATKQKLVRTKGAGEKVRLLQTDSINVTDPKTHKTAKASLVQVTENAANVHYVRRNIITKGAVLETSAGRVRVTSRPGQSGALCGVLVE